MNRKDRSVYRNMKLTCWMLLTIVTSLLVSEVPEKLCPVKVCPIPVLWLIVTLFRIPVGFWKKMSASNVNTTDLLWTRPDDVYCKKNTCKTVIVWQLVHWKKHKIIILHPTFTPNSTPWHVIKVIYSMSTSCDIDMQQVSITVTLWQLTAPSVQRSHPKEVLHLMNRNNQKLNKIDWL